MITNKIITLFHFDEDAEEHKKAFSLPASVLARYGKTATVNGINIDNKATIRIFTSRRLDISEGDYVMIGKQSELDKENALHVSSVTDNRRGSPRMQHWRIDCGE